MAERDLIIHINGWPGSGKLTIAREMAREMGARLLDNHTIINPAQVLFDRRDPLHNSLRLALRAAIFDHLCRMKSGTPLILTDALSDDPYDSGVFEEYRTLTNTRGAMLVAVVLDCSPERNAERLVAPGRAERHKLTSQSVLDGLRSRHRLLRAQGLPLVELDVSELSAAEAARILIERCRAAAESDSQPARPTP
ncbi:MAG TPA: AAA family ATPase [Bosea sp. (in: a-proteobacteria)]|jgi:dephospho-CoA kinase|uniref:AAA family ATPase n=1 Tax=Bosea sp. (in: a-proteobacteria) TaxID=1871050 RepID=UPI002E102DAD|nr:AAA family ATPase [Bosea sp. (in: a-proteobacteria)]